MGNARAVYARHVRDAVAVRPCYTPFGCCQSLSQGNWIRLCFIPVYLARLPFRLFSLYSGDLSLRETANKEVSARPVYRPSVHSKPNLTRSCSLERRKLSTANSSSYFFTSLIFHFLASENETKNTSFFGRKKTNYRKNRKKNQRMITNLLA